MSFSRIIETRIDLDVNGELNGVVDTQPATIQLINENVNATTETNKITEEKTTETPISLTAQSDAQVLESVVTEHNLWNTKLNLLKQNLFFLAANQLANNDIITNLHDLHQNLVRDKQNPSNIIVLDHYLHVSLQLKTGKVFTSDEVIHDTKKLDEKLKSLRPLSANVVASIAGVVGAIIGFAVLLTVGAIASNGIAGIPAGIVGAFKGFTLGTQMAAVWTVEIGLMTGVLGFFAGRRNEMNYLRNTAASERLVESAMNVSNSLVVRA